VDPPNHHFLNHVSCRVFVFIFVSDMDGMLFCSNALPCSLYSCITDSHHKSVLQPPPPYLVPVKAVFRTFPHYFSPIAEPHTVLLPNPSQMYSILVYASFISCFRLLTIKANEPQSSKSENTTSRCSRPMPKTSSTKRQVSSILQQSKPMQKSSRANLVGIREYELNDTRCSIASVLVCCAPARHVYL
jgi:hypothetical protein